MRKLIYLLPVMVLLSSCASMNVAHEDTLSGIMETYMDRDAQTAVQQFGPPNAIYSDGGSGLILHWDYSYTSYRPGIGFSSTSFDWNQYLYGGGSGSINTTTLSVPPARIRNTRFVQLYYNEWGSAYYFRHNMKSQAEIRAEKARENLYWAIGFSAITVLAVAAIANME